MNINVLEWLITFNYCFCWGDVNFSPQNSGYEYPTPKKALQTFVSFLAGAAYGLTSVAVGQPLDTVKTRMFLGNTEGGRW